MGFFESKLEKEISNLRLGQIAPLIAVAVADGVDSNEVKIIHEKAAAAGLRQDELIKVFEDAQEGKYHVVKGDLDNIMSLAMSMAYICMADGKISDVEVKVALQMMQELGAAPEIFPNIIEAIATQCEPEEKELADVLHQRVLELSKVE